MKKLSLLLFVFTGALVFSGCGSSVDSTEVFRRDIKNDFCGPVMNFRYCKCAFHGEFCEEIKMSKKEADDHVQAEFEKWKEKELEAFAKKCESPYNNAVYIFAGGDGKCSYCAEGYKADKEDRSCAKMPSR